MRLAVDANRRKLKSLLEEAIKLDLASSLKEALQKCLELWNRTDEEAKQAAREARKILAARLGQEKKEVQELLRRIQDLQDYLVDKSIWCIGGDGWAYDIGYGGLDHVIASNRNVNLLVLDTEVYSNTGGQASKATPTGSVAKFAASGKKTKKKDLGLMAISYGYVYVASVAMGANANQCLKAFIEAEAYEGPSLIIAYSPCINHGIDMAKSQLEEKMAVEAGYWLLYRYNPLLAKEGKNPLLLDSKEPKHDYQEFIKNEIRYRTLAQQHPEIARKLFAQAAQEARERYEFYKKLAQM